MNVEIGTEAAQFPEKEYINGIFFAVCGCGTNGGGGGGNDSGGSGAVCGCCGGDNSGGLQM